MQLLINAANKNQGSSNTENQYLVQQIQDLTREIRNQNSSPIQPYLLQTNQGLDIKNDLNAITQAIMAQNRTPQVDNITQSKIDQLTQLLMSQQSGKGQNSEDIRELRNKVDALTNAIEQLKASPGSQSDTAVIRSQLDAIRNEAALQRAVGNNSGGNVVTNIEDFST